MGFNPEACDEGEQDEQREGGEQRRERPVSGRVVGLGPMSGGDGEMPEPEEEGSDTHNKGR